jgi:hypothetical protein
MVLEFEGVIFHWRGPAPHYFVAVPHDLAADIKAISRQVTYGWGVIPATVFVGDTRWTTSLFPKNGGYIVPIKAVARKAEGLSEGDIVMLRLEIGSDGHDDMPESA